jgi:hypothetical protein
LVFSDNSRERKRAVAAKSYRPRFGGARNVGGVDVALEVFRGEQFVEKRKFFVVARQAHGFALLPQRVAGFKQLSGAEQRVAPLQEFAFACRFPHGKPQAVEALQLVFQRLAAFACSVIAGFRRYAVGGLKRGVGGGCVGVGQMVGCCGKQSRSTGKQN